ncbi:unnamed protein product (macronuclear) [Paramecium tetraurelia]|uniref:EF-hand domain-containing protein n=2 Tax=Paramecium TaxID=5884 RepID=A0CCU0_PARTE|nr:uncharacterized protein GSPATT00037392001 [Paramecium tetraurelia]CAD8162149.1 unnamed protein product [Paramecium octaurelia]CAK68607.1 unnamed protein product [Paramecium tetraurelia]|eukprot:XP_001436004.1 hypothetical protein (macronuclear) [Paramecium tetraurelia strain d4-2]
MNQGDKPMLQKQQQEIMEIFNEFKSPETNLLNVSEFLEILQTTGLDRNCELLVKKLENLRGNQLDLNQFTEQFNFNYNLYENFEMIFQIMDTTNSGKISKDELKKQSEFWGLQLSERDIEIMITYSGSDEQDSVSKEKLWSLLQQYQNNKMLQ